MVYLGIDLGGSNISIGIVDDKMHILRKGQCPTCPERGEQAVAEGMFSLSQRLLGEQGMALDDIAWVGIGTPGTANVNTGVIEYANNLHFHNVPMVDMAERLFHKRIFIENDANAATYGEYLAGAARGTNSAAVVTLGTGVGSGVIVRGRLLHGINFSGGEAGHTVIEYNGLPCSCGRSGCWEMYSSAPALIRMTKEAMKAHPESLLWSLSNSSLDGVHGKTPFEAMRRGDETAKAVVDRYIGYVGCGLVNIVNIFQPEVLCIGGGVSKEGDDLIRPLAAIIESERYSKHSARQTRLCAATLGNDAGIIGAALLGRLTVQTAARG